MKSTCRSVAALFGISGTELFFIAVFALIIFGPDELPKMARTVGRFMKEFKRAQANMEAMIRAEMLGEERAAAREVEDSPSPIPKVSEEPAAGYDDDEDEEEEE
ncbi:twin-arginine translocase TatA/TatE family subunit [bacterium]|nr:twin-arginine translocase TatA/TatE family subunit [bacterium]